MDTYTLVNIVYLLAAVVFVLGLRLVRHPETARKGNQIVALGMASAVVATLMDTRIERLEYILAGLAIGGLGGLRFARRTPAKAHLPVMALFNGLGGLASWLVAWAEFHAHAAGQGLLGGIALWLAAGLGGAAFSGSVTAWAKLEEKIIAARPLAGRQYITRFAALGVLLTGLLFAGDTVAPDAYRYFALLSVFALIVGVLWVAPFANSDLPTAISLLNGCSGLAACAAGFVAENTLLIAAGALVGGIGTALAIAMCRAKKQPAANVLAGGFAASIEQ